MSTSAQIVQLYYNNIQFLTLGPIVGGPGVTPSKVGVPITDLEITASLYSGRDITNPSITPGSLVSQFGSSGSIVVPHIGNGVYQGQLAPFAITTGTYQLVLDAPASPSGYQLHRERMVSLLTPS